MGLLGRLVIRLILILIIFGLLAWGAYHYFIPGIHLDRDTTIGLDKTNATWIAHEWVGNPQSREAIHGLISTLINNNISLVFVHSGPIDEDGNIPPERYAYAKNFIDTAKEFAPQIKFHAWIGQVRSKLPLEDSMVRRYVINSASNLIENIGFDGIHLNIEPMNNDPYYVKLVKELNNSLGENELSLAVTAIVPKFSKSILKFISKYDTFLGYDLNKTYNDVGYVKNLAENSDYIVLMGYDTGFPTTRLYQWYLEQELIFLLKSAPKKAILGLPTYEDDRPNFLPDVENISNALVGVKNGLSNIRINADKLVGLALYARWTTDENEWTTWRNNWLGLGLPDPENQ